MEHAGIYMNLMQWVLSPFFDYGFMQRAFVGTTALSLSTAPLGVFLVLRRMSLVGDAMSHAILPGVAVGFLFGGLSITAMMLGGIVTGLAVALFSGAVARLTPLKEDTRFAAFYLISLSLGVLLVSWRGSNMDLLHVLFGAVLGLDDTALRLATTVATVTLLILASLYRVLVVECLDPGFLRVIGGGGSWAHMGFLVLVVVNLVVGFQVLGTLMVVGIMVLPAAAARFWSQSLALQILLAACFGVGSSGLGLLASYHFNLPSASAIILVAGVFYLFSILSGPQGGLLWGVRGSSRTPKIWSPKGG